MYTIKFDKNNPYFNPSKQEANMLFLQTQEYYINDILLYRGYIYMNQIFETLGCEWNPDNENVCIRRSPVYCPIQIELEIRVENDGSIFVTI